MPNTWQSARWALLPGDAGKCLENGLRTKRDNIGGNDIEWEYIVGTCIILYSGVSLFGRRILPCGRRWVQLLFGHTHEIYFIAMNQL